jgi:DNA-binding NarL/FixJ family response regulator
VGLLGASVPRAAARVAVFAGTELSERRVAELLRREGFETVGVASVESAGPDDAIRQPDVLVCVGNESPTTTLRRSREGFRDVPVVVVGTSTRRAVREALDAGARGFVGDDELDVRLGPTVGAVAVGQVSVPAEFQEVTGPLLSPREKQVLTMVVLGLTNIEIANRLFVAETTVKSHLSSAYRKLGVRSRQQATALILDSSVGLGLGILSLSEAPAAR